MSRPNSTRTAWHPIAVVTARTGLSGHVLRAWEHRYAVVQPHRDPRGRRLYSDADVELLALLHSATRGGRPVASVVGLGIDRLRTMVAEDAARAVTPAAVPGSHFEQAMLAVRALATQQLEGQLRRALLSLGSIPFIEQVVAPLMTEIGTEWHAGRLSIAQEHAATATVVQLLSGLIRDLELPEAGPRLVLATPRGERHAVGALMAAVVAAHDGWHVTWLGADLPAAQIATAATQDRGQVVALSVATRVTALGGELRALRRALPPHVQLLIGGAGSTRLAASTGHTRIRDLAHWRAVLRLHAANTPE